jgi:hypothetical protein
MVINFKTRKINQDTYNLIQTSTLIKNKKPKVYAERMVYWDGKSTTEIEPTGSYIVQPEIFNLTTYTASWNLN